MAQEWTVPIAVLLVTTAILALWLVDRATHPTPAFASRDTLAGQVWALQPVDLGTTCLYAWGNQIHARPKGETDACPGLLDVLDERQAAFLTWQASQR